MAFEQVMAEIKADLVNEPLKDGGNVAYVCPDGVVVVSLENETLRVEVIAGVPTKLASRLDLVEEV